MSIAKAHGAIQVVWVEYCPPSPNQTRYQHWTKARKHVEQAKLAWLSVLRSSDAAIDFLTTTILQLHTKDSAIAFHAALESTTPTTESGGNTDKSKPEDNPEPS